jgi:hypothetical protein
MNMIATFNRFEFEIPADIVEACSGSGDVTEAVESAVHMVELAHISDDALRDELAEYGAWSDDELSSRTDNETRILWIGACDINERELP